MMQELNYIRCGDYYIPDIRLPEENRPIGRWGRMHRDYIKEHNPIRFNDLCGTDELGNTAELLLQKVCVQNKMTLYTLDDGRVVPRINISCQNIKGQ